jgi:hypothetical protein
MHQQAVLNRHGINIEDITGNTTGFARAPHSAVNAAHEEILIPSSRGD